MVSWGKKKASGWGGVNGFLHGPLVFFFWRTFRLLAVYRVRMFCGECFCCLEGVDRLEEMSCEGGKD